MNHFRTVPAKPVPLRHKPEPTPQLTQLGVGCTRRHTGPLHVNPPGHEYYSNVRHEMVSFLPVTYSRVLEVGCGEGVFATLLKLPCETWGVEPEPTSAARAAARMQRVLAGTFDDVADEIPRGYFDLVVCNDVIEHLSNPEDFLAIVKERMAPGGYIIASIPNMRHWEVLWELLATKDWHYGSSGILDRTHLRFFTEKSIHRLFETSGFHIEQAAGINGAFDPVRRSILRIFGALTLGYYADVQFRQFALRARLR